MLGVLSVATSATARADRSTPADQPLLIFPACLRLVVGRPPVLRRLLVFGRPPVLRRLVVGRPPELRRLLFVGRPPLGAAAFGVINTVLTIGLLATPARRERSTSCGCWSSSSSKAALTSVSSQIPQQTLPKSTVQDVNANAYQEAAHIDRGKDVVDVVEVAVVWLALDAVGMKMQTDVTCVSRRSLTQSQELRLRLNMLAALAMLEHEEPPEAEGS